MQHGPLGGATCRCGGMVDTGDLSPSVERRASSILATGTNYGDVVDLVYAVVSKATGFGQVGSTPTIATK